MCFLILFQKAKKPKVAQEDEDDYDNSDPMYATWVPPHSKWLSFLQAYGQKVPINL